MQEREEIKGVQFGLLSPEEIEAASVALIHTEDAFEGPNPRPGGLFDLRMGTVDKNPCQTCHLPLQTCVGHVGHIILAKPVFHPGFLPWVVDVLRCVCPFCYRLLVDKRDPRYRKVLRTENPEARIKLLLKLVKEQKVCRFLIEGERDDGCGNEMPVIKIVDRLKVQFEFPRPYTSFGDKSKVYVSAERIRGILQRISEEDLKPLGCDPKLARPEWMVLTHLVCLPPCARPSNTSCAAARAEDDLTHKLTFILRTNSHLWKRIRAGAAASEVATLTAMVQYHVANYLDADSIGQSQAVQRMGRPMKGIAQKWKGKEGRIRGNLTGKRLDFSGRTVLSPDPNLSIVEVGIPKSMAMTMTFPEYVNRLNIGMLQEMVNNGPSGNGQGNRYRTGANYLIFPDGKRIDLRFAREEDKVLSEGIIVERHMKDADIVIVNRQPSLHRFSMMAHKVRVMPYSTVRLPLPAMPPYNSDCDGDEHNIVFPQTYEAAAEAWELMGIHRCMLTPQTNSPVMGLIQNALLGLRLLTRRDAFFDRPHAMQMVGFLSGFKGTLPVPAILRPKPLWTGKQLFSFALPPIKRLDRTALFHEEKGDQWFSTGDTRVIIRDGELLSGNLCKRTLGQTHGSLIHVVFVDFGAERNRDFIDDCVALSQRYLEIESVTIGMKDVETRADLRDKVRTILKRAKREMGLIKRQPGITKREFENRSNQMLNDARKKLAENTIRNLDRNNGFRATITAGSKGSPVNPSLIGVLIGQQNVEGGRIPDGFTDRPFVHMKKYADGPVAKGFIYENYRGGLGPISFFCHLMAGREGLTDSSIKTSEIGYTHRKLCKALEDLMCRYDGTVRNSRDEIVQFVYGEDGIDAGRQESQTVDTFCISDSELERYRWDDETIRQDTSGLLTREWNRLKRDAELGKTRRDRSLPLPCNLRRIIDSLPRNRGLTVTAKLVVRDTIELQRQLWEATPYCFERWDSPLAMLLRCNLASKHIVGELQMSEPDWLVLLQTIRSRFASSLSQPGESVGVMSAQSMAAPMTQMTLNTFHYVGQSEKRVTLGVPRLKELTNVVKRSKTPSLTVFFKESFRKNKELVLETMRRMENLLLGSVVIEEEILYEPDHSDTIREQDRFIVHSFSRLPDRSPEDGSCVCDYVIRLTLDSQKLLCHRLTVESLVESVTQVYHDNVVFSWSDEHCDPCVLRMRPLMDRKSRPGEGYVLAKEFLKKVKTDVTISGLQDVSRTYLRWDQRESEYVVDTDGSNLAEVAGFPHVDWTRTYSNDVNEVCKVLGIEAAREVLVRELVGVLSFDSSYINRKHPSLLAELMCHRGSVMSISRHGLNRTESSPLFKCSFEETVDKLLEAARFYTLDNLKGPTERLFLGAIPKFGTGCFGLYLDVEKLSKAFVHEEDVEPAHDYREEQDFVSRDGITRRRTFEFPIEV